MTIGMASRDGEAQEVDYQYNTIINRTIKRR